MSGPLRPSRLLLALMLATLTGCAQLPLGRAPSPEQIDRWVAQHEYGRALEAIDRLPKDDPAAAPLRERRSEIVRQARAYAERRMEAAERHRRKGEWETAFETLYEARRNYPFSKRLGEVLRALERAQHERIAEIERKLALLRTEWQVRAVPLREELARVDAYNRTAEWELEQAREAVAQSFGGLRRCGLEALEAGDLDIAARCLELARRIRPTPRIEAALTQVHERQRSTREARERQQAQAREARERARAEALLAEGRQALDSQDVRAARNVLVQLERASLDHPALPGLRRDLEAVIAAKVEALLHQGSVLYRNGHIREAKDTWQTARELDPDNEAVNERVERAKRVLERVEELRQESDEPATE